MNPLNFLAGGAALGFLAGCWDKVKEAAWKVANLFIDRVEIASEEAHDALIAYLVAHYRHSRFYDRTCAADYEHQRDGRYALVPYEQFGIRTLVFWDGWRPFVFSNQREKRTATPRTDAHPADILHRA